MAKFYLIQRGNFKKTGNSLTGPDGIVNLDYMGSAEFEWGAIPKAYRRLMYHFTEYDVFHTEIYTPEHEELMLFCKKDCAVDVIQALKEFVEQPYSLKEYSELEKVPKAKKEATPYNQRNSNFWWCIDSNYYGNCYGDWMAFLQPQSNLLVEAVKMDFKNWWMNKSPAEREEEYRSSLYW